MLKKYLAIPLALSMFTTISCDDDTNKTSGIQPVSTDPQPGPNNPQPGPNNPHPGPNDPEDPTDTITTEDVIQFNEALGLPIRFVLKLKQKLGVEINQSSLASAVRFNEQLIEKISDLQETWFGESGYGLMDAKTILKIESELFDEDGIHALIGMYTSPDAVIIEGLTQTNEVSESVYLRCKEIIESFGGYFDTTDGNRNMLAIRGAVIDGDKVKRTNTADLYINHIDEAEPDPQNTVHFASGAALNPASGVVPFDDTMLTIWKESSDSATKYYVQAVPLSADPGMQGGNTDGYKFDGTAHLRDGQYIGMIWRHSTSMFNHAHAVLNACYQDTAVFDMLTPEVREPDGSYTSLAYEELESWVNKTELPRVRYAAFTNVYDNNTYNNRKIRASGTSEVIRDFRKISNASDGVIDRFEINTARKVLANLYPSDWILGFAFPDTSLYEALDLWFELFFEPYTEEECQYLFGLPASIIYDDSFAQTRASLFKNVFTRYRDTDMDIGINIHTSPDFETSSQGCLNIPISSYPAFISVNAAAISQSYYLYTLVDASKIKGIAE